MGVHLFCEPLQHCIFVWLTLISLHFINIKYKSLIIIQQISNVLLTVCLPCVAMMRYCECGTQGVSPNQWLSMLQGVGSGGLSHTHRTQLSYSLRQCTMASTWCSGTHSILEVSTYVRTYDVISPLLWRISAYDKVRLEWHSSSRPPYTISAVTIPYLSVNSVMRYLWWDWCVWPFYKLLEQTHLQCFCVVCVLYWMWLKLQLSQLCLWNRPHRMSGFTHLLFPIQCQR